MLNCVTCALNPFLVASISGVSSIRNNSFFSNLSQLQKMSGIIESICSLESELWVRRLVAVLGAFILTAANVAFIVSNFTAYSYMYEMLKLNTSRELCFTRTYT